MVESIPASAGGPGLVILASRLLAEHHSSSQGTPSKGPFRYTCSSVVVETVWGQRRVVVVLFFFNLFYCCAKLCCSPDAAMLVRIFPQAGLPPNRPVPSGSRSLQRSVPSLPRAGRTCVLLRLWCMHHTCGSSQGWSPSTPQGCD